MGFLGRIFGKKEATEEVKKEKLLLKFGEIPSFSEKFYSESFSGIEKDVFSKLAEIKHLIKELEVSLNELEKQEVEQDKGHRKLRKIVATSKKTLISKMRNLSGKLVPPKSTDFIELNSYCNNSVKLLESEINAFGKNIAYTGIVLKESVQELGKKINELNSVFLDTKKFFDSKKGLLLFSEINEFFVETKKKIESKEESVSLEKEISAKIALTENEIEAIQDKLSDLEGSIEAKQYNSLLEEKCKLMEKKQQTKTKLTELFYPVEKLLRLFRKIVEAKHFVLTSEEKSLLTFYLSNPFFALKKDNKAETLKKIFNYIKELINDGEISLKEKEKEKKLSSLNQLIEFDFFGKFFWELNKIEKKLNELEARINSLNISSKIFSLKDELASLKNSKENYSVEMQKQKTNTQSISGKITLLINSLESKLSDFSEKEVNIGLKH